MTAVDRERNPAAVCPGGWRGYDGVFLQQLINGLTLGAVYGLIAIGYTMVYGIIGMINFAHGEVYMVSAYLCAIGPGAALLLRDPLLSAADFRHSGVHHRGHRRIRLGDRAHRLPAAAQLDAAGAADLGYRDVADPAELCPAEPGAEPAGDPDAA